MLERSIANRSDWFPVLRQCTPKSSRDSVYFCLTVDLDMPNCNERRIAAADAADR